MSSGYFVIPTKLEESLIVSVMVSVKKQKQ